MSEPSRVNVKWVGEHKFDASRPGRPSARFDGDGLAGPSPVDGLLGSLGACTAVDVVDILAKRRTPVELLEVEVVGARVDTVPRRLQHVTLNFRIGGAGIDRIHAERAVDLAVTKYCSVRDSLRPDVPVVWTLELESEKGVKPAKARPSALKYLRLVLAVAVFLLSLLAVVPAPNYLAWELSILVTELGWIVALAALVVFLVGPRRSRVGRIATLLSGAAVILVLSPLVRATRIARAVPGELSTAFGDAPPKSLPGAPARSKPFAALDLVIGLRKSHVRNDSMTFAVPTGKPLGLNLYRPLNYSGGALPLVVMIHGGSWRGGTRHDLDALNSYLAARGYAVASISYRLAPQYHHPAPSEDVSSAIRFLSSNAARLEIDPSRTVLIGRSAGAQLALLAAYTATDPSIRGVIGLYAPSDQVFGYENPSNPHVINSTEVLENYLAGNPTTAPAAYRSASPVNFVGPSTPPTLLIHGAKDELVWVLQSERLDGRLEVAHRQHLFLRLPWATHGCDYFFNGPCGQISTYAIERFLAAVLK